MFPFFGSEWEHQFRGQALHKEGHGYLRKASIIHRVGENTEGFVLEGRTANGEIGGLLEVYHNGGSNPDAVNYNGRISSAQNIVNKEYVDNHVSRKIEALEARIRELEARLSQ